MAVAAKFAIPEGSEETAPLALVHAPEALVLIDAEAGEIIEASETGAAALGLFPYASYPIGLDPATPALNRLRDLAATSSEVVRSETETLTFGTGFRQRPVKCKIARPGGGRAKVFLLYILSDPSSEMPRAGIPLKPFAVPPSLAEKIAVAAEAHRAAQSASATITLSADHLAKLAHELKTPLTAIAAAAEIMRDERLGEMKNERYLAYAADIYDSAIHALDVIGSLLTESGRPSEPVRRPLTLDLDAAVEKTVSGLRVLAGSLGLTLAFEPGAGKSWVVADPTALRQVLINLLTNAIKFTPRGGDVRIVTGHLDDKRVFLVIRDNGRGIKPPGADGSEAAAHGFHPTWGQSNGIGLPLVETLVREMGAELEIESFANKGTTVRITFGALSKASERTI